MTCKQNDLLDNVLHSLNEKQREAVTAPTSEPLQIRAGPGTGKTKVLVARVAYLLLHHKIPPQNVIVTTFTKKAAQEMVERLDKLLQGSGILCDKLLIGTFHSISYRIIQKYGASDGLIGFAVVGEKDSSQILDEVLENDITDSDWDVISSMSQRDILPFIAKLDMSEEIVLSNKHIKLDKKKIMRQISKLKAHAVFPEDYQKQHDSNFFLSKVFSQYQKRLLDLKLLDFDDCLLYCLRIITRRPVLRFVQHTLVDEFQDTNEIQLQLMFQFARVQKQPDSKTSCSVTIVGDLDQSIYAFRDAQVGNFDKMLEYYARQHSLNCLKVSLVENYRSSSDILAFSEKVMRQQQNRAAKSLVSQMSYSIKPIKAILNSADEEARWVAHQISQIMLLPQMPFSHSDIAVLVRSAYQTRILETEFVKRKIPYTMVKGRAFWERKEVVAVIDYLRCVANPNDRLALFRSINYPKRGIGPVALSELERLCHENMHSNSKHRGDITEQVRFREEKTEESEKNNLCLSILKAISKKEIKSSLGTKVLHSLRTFLEVIEKTQLFIKKGYPEDQYKRQDMFSTAFDELLSNSGLRVEFGEDENRLLNVEEVKTQLILFEVPLPENELPEYTETDSIKTEMLQVVDESAGVIELGLKDDRNMIDLTSTEPSQDFLSLFIALVTLYETASTTDDQVNQPRVSISTIHGAKGLEWPVVFIPGVSEGLIPASFALDGTEESTNEERRCFYVASTRAKTLLYLSAYTEDSGKLNFGRKPIEKVSRFLSNMDQSFSMTPFESEAWVSSLYQMLNKQPPENFDFSSFRKKYLRSFSLYVKQTTDAEENKPGFVTGLEAKELCWTSNRIAENARGIPNTLKRKVPLINIAPQFSHKIRDNAPFKPVIRRMSPNTENKHAVHTTNIGKVSSTNLNAASRAPTYIPQRAKHKRRLGTR